MLKFIKIKDIKFEPILIEKEMTPIKINFKLNFY